MNEFILFGVTFQWVSILVGVAGGLVFFLLLYVVFGKRRKPTMFLPLHQRIEKAYTSLLAAGVELREMHHAFMEIEKNAK